jgi:hypothetical protein
MPDPALKKSEGEVSKKRSALPGVRFVVIASSNLKKRAQSATAISSFPVYFPDRVAFHLFPPAVPSIELPLTRPVYSVPAAVKVI